MAIPLELRADPPGPALEWVARCIGPDAQVTAVHRLRNAWAAAMHAVDVDDGRGARHELVLRRWARTDLPPDAGVVENEAAALALLAGAADPGLRTPRLVAHDAEGAHAGVPALVMTRLPGTPRLDAADLDPFLDGLVGALHAIHAVTLPERPLPARPLLGTYRPWGVAGPAEPPPWTRRPDVWRRAFAIAREPVPAYAPVLCHRDFHPGNVLWHGGEVSGVVDWTHTCRGPAAADVAHCRANLALLFGLDVADDFARRYGPVDDLAWFDVVTAAGWRELSTWRWHDAGRTDITDETGARARDAFLADAVARCS